MVVVYCLTTLEPVFEALPTPAMLASKELLVCLGEGKIARPFAFTSEALATAYRAREISHLPASERQWADLHVSRIPVRGGEGAKTLYSMMLWGVRWRSPAPARTATGGVQRGPAPARRARNDSNPPFPPGLRDLLRLLHERGPRKGRV